MLCEVCLKNAPVGVCAVPGVPMSCAYCAECLAAGAHPWVIVVTNTALAGERLEDTVPWWQELAHATMKHLGKTREEFDVDVASSLKLMTDWCEQDLEEDAGPKDGQ